MLPAQYHYEKPLIGGFSLFFGEREAMFIKGGKSWTYAIFAVVVLSSALGNLSQTGLNAMLVTVCDELSITTGVGQWLTTAYMFVLGAVVPLASYLMGRFRLKDLTVLSIIIFIIGAGIAACATSFSVLLVGRIVQAVAAGILLPLLQTIAMTRFPDGRKATAMGISGVAMGFAPNIGPTIGGAMVGELGWRSFFVMLVVFSGIILLFCLVCIKRHDDASLSVSLDLPSFVLCTSGFGGILIGCSEASSQPLASPYIWIPILMGVLCLLAFAARQRRQDDPLIDLSIFDNANYRMGFWAQCFLCASFMGITLLVPLFIEDFRGGTALEAGMVLLPGTVAALIFNPVAGIMTDRIGIRPVAVSGGLFLTAGALGMSFMDADTPLWLIMTLQGVRAVGVSSLIGPLTSWSLMGLQGKMTSDGSAFGLAARQTAASVGTALMILCIEGVPLLAGAFAYQVAFGVSAVFSIATFVCILMRVK